MLCNGYFGRGQTVKLETSALFSDGRKRVAELVAQQQHHPAGSSSRGRNVKRSEATFLARQPRGQQQAQPCFILIYQFCGLGAERLRLGAGTSKTLTALTLPTNTAQPTWIYGLELICQNIPGEQPAPKLHLNI